MKHLSHLLGIVCIAIILLFLSVTVCAQIHARDNYIPTDAHKIYGVSLPYSQTMHNFTGRDK